MPVVWLDIYQRQVTTLSSLDDVELTLIESMDDVFAFKRWLGERRSVNAIALDTETSGLNPFNDRVRLIQIGDGRHGWAFSRDDWLGLLKDVVRVWTGDYICHNSSFDALFLDLDCNVHIPRNRIHDTMIQARINESHLPMGLKAQAARHIDSAAAGLQAELKGTAWTWDTVPIDYGPYWMYGALDPVLTYLLHEHHYDTTMRVAPKAYEIEMAVLWVCEKMRRYGAYVDRQTATRRLQQFADYCDRVERWVKDEYGIKAGANAAVIEVLEEFGFQFTKATKAGAVALDKEVLEGIDHPLAQAVLGRRQAQKMASTYLRFYTERSDENSLLHPSFNTVGARTSRMSCNDPNLQNLPRLGTSKFGDVVRNCIVSRYIDPAALGSWSELQFTERDAVEHGSLLMADFDQIEMRILSHFAQEPAMIEAFKQPDDFFVSLARQLFEDDTIVKKDKRRQITKNAGYAKIYFAGIRKFAQTAGIPESQARTFMQRWNQLYPNVERFSQRVITTAAERRANGGLAYARCPITGRHHVADSGKEYALVNYLIQGAAASINKMKLIELAAAGLDEYMFATVHDEVLLDVPGHEVLHVVNTLNKIMNDDQLLDVPITAGVSFGAQWGRKKDWELV